VQVCSLPVFWSVYIMFVVSHYFCRLPMEHIYCCLSFNLCTAITCL
jgi:hypothetical protein